jgi:hypothetical protein
MQKAITHKQRQRAYQLHYRLRKRGHKVLAKQRTIIKKSIDVSKIENKWLNELTAMCYAVCNPMFNN